MGDAGVRLLAAAAATVVLAGCSALPGAAQHRSTPAPGASPAGSGAPAGSLVAWQEKGATQVPPPSLASVGLGSVEVVNETSGAVSDADVRRWAAAYVRANAYEFWAWNNQQDAFLLHSGLSQVPAAVFSYDLSTIRDAKAAGARLEVTRLVLRRLVLRPVPEALRQTFANHVYLWTQYAFYLDQLGPSRLDWIDAGGAHTTKAKVDPGTGSPELVGGVMTTDPLMGDIWVSDSDWDCSSPGVREPFGALCNP
jgi:hypothetical protein